MSSEFFDNIIHISEYVLEEQRGGKTLQQIEEIMHWESGKAAKMLEVGQNLLQERKDQRSIAIHNSLIAREAVVDGMLEAVDKLVIAIKEGEDVAKNATALGNIADKLAKIQGWHSNSIYTYEPDASNVSISTDDILPPDYEESRDGKGNNAQTDADDNQA